MPAGALTEKKLVWFKDEPAKADVQAEISRLVGQQARKAGELKGGQGQPLAFSESEVDPGEGALAITPPEGEEVGDRLKRLRREVGKAKEGKKKKDKSEGSGKRRPRKKERGSPLRRRNNPCGLDKRSSPSSATARNHLPTPSVPRVIAGRPSMTRRRRKNTRERAANANGIRRPMTEAPLELGPK